MLFVVTLNNRSDAEQIQQQQADHRNWLVANTRAGRIVVAGPLESRTGGLIVAQCAERSELNRMMDEDPFVIHGLVELQVQCVEVALRNEGFPARWADEAKAVAEDYRPIN